MLLQLDTSGKALRLSRVSLGFWIVADNMLKRKLKAQQHEVNVHFFGPYSAFRRSVHDIHIEFFFFP